MRKHATLVSDCATVLVYAALLYYDKFVWAATGFHLAVRYSTDTLRSSCVCVSLLQLSNTCERMRAVVPPAAGYGIAGLGLLLCAATRSEAFQEVPTRTRGVVVVMFYTLALTINRVHNVSQETDVARVVLFVSLAYMLRKNCTMSDWEEEARTCWVLACYALPALGLALLQLALDTGGGEGQVSLPTHIADIETWDVVSPPAFTLRRKRQHT